MGANEANLIRAIRWPVTMITLGCLFFLHRSAGFNVGVLLIVFGVLTLFARGTVNAPPDTGQGGKR